jgi:HSP20 family protein
LTVEKNVLNVLSVHTERSRPESDGVEMLLAERPQGTFSRQLFLGETLDTERIEAEYTNGVLTLRIPVAETAKPRKVAINSDNNERMAIHA